MTKQRQVYKCELCGNIIEVLHTGEGELVCCGQPMTHLVENSVDAAKEKHVPVIDVQGDTVRVSVGSVPHPMEDKHFIQWIELMTAVDTCRRYLNPGEKSEATFCHPGDGALTARAYCNLHGLWKSV